MARYEFRGPGGRNVWFEAPDGQFTSQEAAENWWWDQYKSQQIAKSGQPREAWEQELKAGPFMQYEASTAFGAPQEEIDVYRGIPFFNRMRLGLLADPYNRDETMAALRRMYPEAVIAPVGESFAIQQPGQPPMFANPPGAELGSIGQWLGEASFPMAGSIGGGAAGVLVGHPTAVAAAGASAMEGVREGVQKLFGTSREPMSSVQQRMAISGAMEALPTPAQVWRGVKKGTVGTANFVKNLFTKRVAEKAAAGTLSEAEQALAHTFLDFSETEIGEAVKYLQGHDIGVSDLMNFQKSESRVLQRLASQYMQLSDTAQKRYLAQLNALGRASREIIPELDDPAVPDEMIQRKLGAAYKRRMAELVPSTVEPEEAGRAMILRVKGTVLERKAAMNRGYDSLEELVDEWKPKYDMSSAKAAAVQRKQMGYGLSPEESAQVFAATPGVVPPGVSDDLAKGVNITGEPVGDTWFKKAVADLNVVPDNRKLAHITEIMARLDPRQDYYTVKELRSQVGRLLDLPEARLMESGVDIGQAKNIYRQLSDVLEKPLDVTGGALKNIVRRTKEANTLAKKYYDTYDIGEVAEVLLRTQHQQPGQLFNAFRNNPAKFEPAFREVLDEVTKSQRPTEALGIIRRNLETDILAQDNALDAFKQFKDKAPAVMRWLFPTEQKMAVALENAKRITDLNKSVLREAADAAYTQSGIGLKALEQYINKGFAKGMTQEARIAQLLKDLGESINYPMGKVAERSSLGRDALRELVVQDVISNSLTTHAGTGAFTLDPTRLVAEVRKLRKSGIVGAVLTNRDRAMLSALETYAKRVVKKGDAGTGLTIAAQLGKVRHGDVGAIANLRLSMWAAKMLTNTELPWQMFLDTVAPSQTIIARSTFGRAVSATTRAFIRQGLIAAPMKKSMEEQGNTLSWDQEMADMLSGGQPPQNYNPNAYGP